MGAQRLSVVVPALNEASGIRPALEALAPLRAGGHEVIVVDGGSSDGTPELARGLCDRVLSAPRGRAPQMNVGAAAATGDALVFLHADTRLPQGADELIFQSLRLSPWGRFDVEIDARHPLLRVVACALNLRSRLTGIATGDQAIFVRREVFPGFPNIELMEAVAFCKAMKRFGPPVCRRERVVTSGRRWESRGVL
ncbi:MAG TPA: TIGR04283 family arsenosugar biosynthesis glycosyltransferase, partial [Burkholderiales bacterium]|nr:TIGR04283 family arsenosugar biosynthesis glycosyltransferase [Burkholderiales bacterium]